jgi:hypothetical protein
MHVGQRVGKSEEHEVALCLSGKCTAGASWSCPSLCEASRGHFRSGVGFHGGRREQKGRTLLGSLSVCG